MAIDTVVIPQVTEAERWPAALWFAGAIYWVGTAALVLSIVGLMLAVVGVLRPVVLLAIAIPSFAALGRAGWHPFRHAAGGIISGGILPVVAVLVIVVASSLSAVFFSAEHLKTERDPGMYLATARWLADEGTLVMSGSVGGFADVEGVTAYSPEFYEDADAGTVHPQFLHLLPVWGAAAHWIGGDQMLLRVNAAVIFLAIASVWLFAATLLRPWFAVLVTAAVAVSLPTVHFARNLYSEPLAMLFVFAGLALLTLARVAEQRWLSVIAGLFVGAVTMVRIDGWVAVIAVVAYLMAVWWSAQEEKADATIRGFVHPALMGVFITGSVGLVDGLVRSRPYLVARSSQVALMFGALAIVVLVSLIALHRPEPFRHLVAWYQQRRDIFAWLVPVAVAIVAASLYFVRPLVQETTGTYLNPFILFTQQAEGLPLDGTRIYFEWSMHWLSWYLGISGLTLAVIGVAWAWRKAMLGARELWPFLLLVSLTTMLYLIRPSITADQLWAMRRYLPVVLPGLILAGVLAIQWVTEGLSRRPLRWGAVAVALGILIVVPATITWPLRTSTSYVGLYDAIEEVCAAIPEGSAVLMTNESLSATYQPTVRSFCGVPVSGILGSEVDLACVIASANTAWAARGVSLFVGYRDELDLEADTSISVAYDIPELTLTRAPARPTTFGFDINLASADGLDPLSCPS